MWLSHVLGANLHCRGVQLFDTHCRIYIMLKISRSYFELEWLDDASLIELYCDALCIRWLHLEGDPHVPCKMVPRTSLSR